MPDDFRKTTDDLLAPITHDRLAKYLECGVATLRQARLDPSAKAYRKPPEGWESGVAELAETEGYRLLGLAKSLRKPRRK